MIITVFGEDLSTGNSLSASLRAPRSRRSPRAGGGERPVSSLSLDIDISALPPIIFDDTAVESDAACVFAPLIVKLIKADWSEVVVLYTLALIVSTTLPVLGTTIVAAAEVERLP